MIARIIPAVRSAINAVLTGLSTATATAVTAADTIIVAIGKLQAQFNLTVTAYISSNFTTASTTLVDVTGGTVAMEANKDYELTIHVLFQSSSATNGIWFSLSGPASPTSVAFNYTIPISTTANANRNQSAYNAGSAHADVPAANTTYYARIIGIIRNGANAGNLQLRVASETATNVSVMAGTVMKITKTN